jgi:uncharacterized membrane protein
MTKHHFTFQEVFMFGWNKTKQHAWFIFLTFIIISTIISAAGRTPFLNLIVSLMAGLSLASISLMIVRNRSFSFADIFNPLLSYKRVLKFFALAAFFALPMILVGFTGAILVLGAANGSASVATFGIILTIILLVPSIFFAVRFKFFPFVVIEHENASVTDLVLMSYRLTENNFWSLLGYILIAIGFNMVGAMLIGFGLIFTIPVTILATAYLYDRFKNHSA